MASEYPKALYRDGGAEMIWGKPVQTRAVASEDEETEAVAQGWRLHPIADEPERRRPGRPPKVRTDDADTD